MEQNTFAKMMVGCCLAAACNGSYIDNAPPDMWPDLGPRPAVVTTFVVSGAARTPFGAMGVLEIVLQGAADVAARPPSRLIIDGQYIQQTPPLSPDCLGIKGIAVGDGGALVAYREGLEVGRLPVAVRRAVRAYTHTPPPDIAGTGEVEAWLDVAGRLPLQLTLTGGEVLGSCPGYRFGVTLCFLVRRNSANWQAVLMGDGVALPIEGL